MTALYKGLGWLKLQNVLLFSSNCVLAIAHLSSLHEAAFQHKQQCMQVSFGVHEEEESAARQYDRALLIEKGRAAKTNFPLPDYEKESKQFEGFVVERYSWHALHADCVIKHASIWQHAGIMWTLLQLSMSSDSLGLRICLRYSSCR